MRRLTCAFLVVAVGGYVDRTEPTEPPLASALEHDPHYRVVILQSSLGGTESHATGISNRGWVAGYSFETGDANLHAALWRDGSITDLETLGGLGSRVPWPGLNDRGMVVGISHTAELDSLNEAWSCEQGGFLPETNPRQVCRGFLWQHGVMHELPTLGGTHGFATGVNNRGQVVGWAETPVHDPTCTGEQVLQFRAVLWEPRKRMTRELPPFPGDSASAAVAINERGQAVGISGACDQAVGRFSARHAVLWTRGEVREIPNLGGSAWHTPQSINEAGDVVGFSNPPGPGDPEGAFIAHAFVWLRGSSTAIDLGTLSDEDPFSQAQAINARRQVVGVSFGGPRDSPEDQRAFLWQHDIMMDLNDLAGPEFGLDARYQLLSARDISARGQITGDVLERSTGRILPFVATPRAIRLR